MRNLIFSLGLVLLTGLMSGCATSEILKQAGGPEERLDISYITVTSTPSDAEIYIDDKLVGRTPSDEIPFSYRYKVWRQPFGLDFGNPDPNGTKRYDKVSDNIIRISKKDYKDAFVTINPDQTEYHFNLVSVVSAQTQSIQEASSTAAADSGSVYSQPSHGLRLQAILYASGQAIINNRVLQAGDSIDGNSLIEIRKDRVILNDGGKDFELSLAQVR